MKSKKIKNAFAVGDIVRVKGVKPPRLLVIGSHILKALDGSEAEMVDVQWFCLGRSLQTASFKASVLQKAIGWW